MSIQRVARDRDCRSPLFANLSGVITVVSILFLAFLFFLPLFVSLPFSLPAAVQRNSSVRARSVNIYSISCICRCVERYLFLPFISESAFNDSSVHRLRSAITIIINMAISLLRLLLFTIIIIIIIIAQHC